MAKQRLLRLQEVDLISFVDKGDNPQAFVTLAKRADIQKAPMKTEGGVQYPAAAFAYVPDAQTPSTWKLRLWDASKKETAAQVGRAVAALGPGGFRGNRVQIPSSALGGVKGRVRAAWRRTHGSGEQLPAVLKAAGTTATHKEEHMAQENTIDIELDGLPEDVQEAFKALTGRIGSLETELAEAKAAVPTKKQEEPEPKPEPEPEPARITADAILSALKDAIGGEEEGLEPKVAKAVEGVQSEITKAQDEANAERAKREELEKRLNEIEKRNRTERFIKLAKSLDNLPNVTADDFASVLDKVEASVTDEEFDAISKVLAGANEAIAESALMKVLGADGGADPDSAAAELTKRAKAMVEADPKLSDAQARDRVLAADPDLNQRVLNEEEKNWAREQ